MTSGDGAVIGDTVLDIGFSNVNPVIHVPATILGVSTMENWGNIFGDYDKSGYSMYSHALSPSICEVQYQFYNEEIALRSEEHTSELQSRGHIVCRLLLEIKNKIIRTGIIKA